MHTTLLLLLILHIHDYMIMIHMVHINNFICKYSHIHKYIYKEYILYFSMIFSGKDTEIFKVLGWNCHLSYESTYFCPCRARMAHKNKCVLVVALFWQLLIWFLSHSLGCISIQMISSSMSLFNVCIISVLYVSRPQRKASDCLSLGDNIIQNSGASVTFWR